MGPQIGKHPCDVSRRIMRVCSGYKHQLETLIEHTIFSQQRQQARPPEVLEFFVLLCKEKNKKWEQGT